MRADSSVGWFPSRFVDVSNTIKTPIHLFFGRFHVACSARARPTATAGRFVSSIHNSCYSSLRRLDSWTRLLLLYSYRSTVHRRVVDICGLIWASIISSTFRHRAAGLGRTLVASTMNSGIGREGVHAYKGASQLATNMQRRAPSSRARDLRRRARVGRPEAARPSSSCWRFPCASPPSK